MKEKNRLREADILTTGKLPVEAGVLVVGEAVAVAPGATVNNWIRVLMYEIYSRLPTKWHLPRVLLLRPRTHNSWMI
jgi:hypothetical protein